MALQKLELACPWDSMRSSFQHFELALQLKLTFKRWLFEATGVEQTLTDHFRRKRAEFEAYLEVKSLG